jgi:hypothetical protein
MGEEATQRGELPSYTRARWGGNLAGQKNGASTGPSPALPSMCGLARPRRPGPKERPLASFFRVQPPADQAPWADQTTEWDSLQPAGLINGPARYSNAPSVNEWWCAEPVSWASSSLFPFLDVCQRHLKIQCPFNCGFEV